MSITHPQHRGGLSEVGREEILLAALDAEARVGIPLTEDEEDHLTRWPEPLPASPRPPLIFHQKWVSPPNPASRVAGCRAKMQTKMRQA